MLIFSLGLLPIAAMVAALLEELVSVLLSVDTGAMGVSPNFAGNLERDSVEERVPESPGGRDLERVEPGFDGFEEVPGASGIL